MEIRTVKERKHRLPLASYEGRVRVSYTICILNKISTFIHPSIVQEFTDILRSCVDKNDCLNWVYIFMPDHMHLVLEGKNEQSKLWKAVNLFKQHTGFWFSRNLKDGKWQKDYYDHILRKDEDLKKQIVYILNNPVRKDLASHWREYPFKGSLHYNLKEIIL